MLSVRMSESRSRSPGSRWAAPAPLRTLRQMELRPRALPRVPAALATRLAQPAIALEPREVWAQETTLPPPPARTHSRLAMSPKSRITAPLPAEVRARRWDPQSYSRITPLHRPEPPPLRQHPTRASH